MASPQESTQKFRWHYADFDDADLQFRGRSLFFFVVLISIILLVTLLFLYARWVCNVEYSPPPAPPHPTISAAPAPTLGLDSTTINGLPIVLYRSSVDSESIMESECCICLGMFGDGDKVKELPGCKHVFHSECVDKWLNTHSSCPLCRASLRADSPV
ncbi:RING-H2 finger protein ATL66-like [Primulina tabacum]|uniref:RING-H2 finger protein ATL66-like n=1 Tax=Primulina tabacum TaxID=48773 RepID=UPI003F59F58A